MNGVAKEVIFLSVRGFVYVSLGDGFGEFEDWLVLL
tara:strand:+ start:465 stop:572 length:108 start_codon:yes stop_codon:yes gene_type:complete